MWCAGARKESEESWLGALPIPGACWGWMLVGMVTGYRCARMVSEERDGCVASISEDDDGC